MLDEDKIKYYDEFNLSEGSSEDAKILEQELTDELSGFLTSEELKKVIEEETKNFNCNKNIKVKLLQDYTRWGTKDFIKGAIGVVKDWKFFRYHGGTWKYAYVLVTINNEDVPVNIDKLEVLDENFLKIEKNYFQQYKNTYKYIPSDNLLKLNDDIEIHCTGLINRILNYLEED